jgi:hypothetical protein
MLSSRVPRFECALWSPLRSSRGRMNQAGARRRMTDSRTSDGLSGPEAKAPEAARGGRSRLQSRRPQRHTRAHHPGGRAGRRPWQQRATQGYAAQWWTSITPSHPSPTAYTHTLPLSRSPASYHVGSPPPFQRPEARSSCSQDSFQARRSTFIDPTPIPCYCSRTICEYHYATMRSEGVRRNGQSGDRRAFIIVMSRSMLC